MFAAEDKENWFFLLIVIVSRAPRVFPVQRKKFQENAQRPKRKMWVVKIFGCFRSSWAKYFHSKVSSFVAERILKPLILGEERSFPGIEA